MQRVGSGASRALHEGSGVEIGLRQGPPGEFQCDVGLSHIGRGAVLRAIDRCRFETRIMGAPNDAPRDLTPVGHQDTVQAPRCH